MMENKYKYLAMNDEYAKRVCYPENKHTIRTEFERDRDRILYSRAFRRLSGKTQVFLAGNDDHTRTRLTHTLEVAQISRTIAKALELNGDLTEAIALGHDIGHTPFGHVGERMLNRIMNGCYKIRDFNSTNVILNNARGFKHNWQSVRVSTELESTMNLTDYTLWGMLNHSNLKNKPCEVQSQDQICLFRHEEEKCNGIKLDSDDSLSFYTNITVNGNNVYESIKGKWSFEGIVVGIADEIAQRHHDIEDALEYNIIDKNELYKKLSNILNFQEYEKTIKEEYTNKDDNCCEKLLSSINEHKQNLKEVKESVGIDSIDSCKAKLAKFIVNLLTTDIIYSTQSRFNELIKKFDIKSQQDFYNHKDEINSYKDIKEDIVRYSNFIKQKDEELKDFLRDTILNSHKAQTMDGVGQHVIKELFKAYIINPQQLPDKTIVKLFVNLYKNDKNELDKYKYEDLNNYNVGSLRNILSKYHYNAKKSDKNKIDYKELDYNYYKIQLLRTICDYIAGMTDKYTIDQHRKLYNIV
jgi:dGTPase